MGKDSISGQSECFVAVLLTLFDLCWWFFNQSISVF